MINRNQICGSMLEACSLAGVAVPTRSLVPGAWSVVPSLASRKRSNCAGRIKLFSDTQGGTVWNWITGERVIWFDDWNKSLTPYERQKHAAEMRKQLEQLKREEAERRKKGAKLAAHIYARSERLSIDHQYLKDKHVRAVQPMGVLSAAEIQKIFDKWYPNIEPERYPENPRQLWDYKTRKATAGAVLIVPLYRFDQCANGLILSSLELISETGAKYALPAAGARSCFWLPESLTANGSQAHVPVIGVAEGVATAMSITEVTGVPIVAARSCGNIRATGAALYSMAPTSRLVIFGDLGNGSEQAWQASIDLCCRVSFPAFSDELKERYQAITGKTDSPTDFNDFYIARGQL